MAEQVRQHELAGAREDAQREMAGAERYAPFPGLAGNGRVEAVDRPGPLEFDESGFPIAQRTPRFTERVARLRSAF
jgi:hypothetical protein